MTINVDDLNDEPPAAPFPPTVVSGKDSDTSDETEESTTRLHVVWHPPENMGDDISGYDVQYKKSVDTEFTDLDPAHSGTVTTATPSTLLRRAGSGHVLPGAGAGDER